MPTLVNYIVDGFLVTVGLSLVALVTYSVIRNHF